MARFTPEQIYSTAREAGFPPETAVKMTAIALRESAGQTDAFNGTGPDQSYGLWQINMIGDLGRSRIEQFGLSAPTDLFDPLINAQAAYAIWNGSDRNLDLAWYIKRNPTEAAKYQANLPTAISAAQTVDGYSPIGGDAGDEPVESGVVDTTQILILAGIALIVVGVMMFRD